MSLDAEIAAFVAEYAAAWSAFDTDAVAAFVALPYMVVTAGATHFYEDATEVEDALDRAADDLQAHGVTAFEATLVSVEGLPDDAARAEVAWRRLGADGALKLSYVARYTLAKQDGHWGIVVADVTAESAATWH